MQCYCATVGRTCRRKSIEEDMAREKKKVYNENNIGDSEENYERGTERKNQD